MSTTGKKNGDECKRKGLSIAIPTILWCIKFIGCIFVFETVFTFLGNKFVIGCIFVFETVFTFLGNNACGC